jgi:hypothetical protein
MSIEKGNETSNNEMNPNDVSPVGNNSDTSGSESEKVYNEGFVNKLKGEKDNLRKRIEQLEAEKRESEEKALKEKEDYKTLYEKTKLENESLTGKLDSAENLRLNAKKESELKSELAKLGVKPSYAEKAVKLANLDSIKLDKDSGVIYGAEVVAKSLSEDWPDLFGSQSTEKVTQTAPASPTTTGALSLEQWQKLPYDERRKREGEMLQTMGVQMKR